MILLNIFKDTISDSKRIKISEKEIISCCKELQEKVVSAYNPDVIVAIAMGGSMIGDILAGGMNVPVIHLVIKRNISIGRMYRRLITFCLPTGLNPRRMVIAQGVVKSPITFRISVPANPSLIRRRGRS